MTPPSPANSVLANYSIPKIVSFEDLNGAGGFSGAQLWRIETTDRQQLCLRCWPVENPSIERLEWLHRVLIHGAHFGSKVLASPLPASNGNTFSQHANHLWELSEWKTGTADFHSNPSEARLTNIMTTLAKVHMAFAQVQLDFRFSDGLRERCEGLQRLEQALKRIEQSPKTPYQEIERLRVDLFSTRFKRPFDSLVNRVLSRLSKLQQTPFPVQPVIKDLWHDHILLTGDAVTGIVDYGAMQMDSVALDLGRLLGSLLGGDQERWDNALSQYSEIRRLGETEVELAKSVDLANVILAAVHWLTWILVEQRHFENMDAVQNRVAAIHRRLDAEMEIDEGLII